MAITIKQQQKQQQQLLLLVSLAIVVLCGSLIGLVSADCACQLGEKPDAPEKAKTARWMVHSLDWGVLSTISSRLGDEDSPPVPFGNIYSFVDGPCGNGTGTPYFYGTYMDASFSDTKTNNRVSLSLSESALGSVCPEQEAVGSCTLGSEFGDPENPMCARLTLTGTMVVLDEASDEYVFAKDAFFERHTSMKNWPTEHGWIIGKIDIQDVWLIDFFGGATIMDPKDYYAADKDDDDEALVYNTVRATPKDDTNPPKV